MKKLLLILFIFSAAHGMDSDHLLKEADSIGLQDVVIELPIQNKKYYGLCFCPSDMVKKIALGCGVPSCILLTTLIVVVWSIWR